MTGQGPRTVGAVTGSGAYEAFRLPHWNDSMGWLWFYAEALRGDHGQAWQAFAEQHERSGRTDGTSWRKWRDECISPVVEQ